MSTPTHPTMRTIAAAAGVCPATVSLALRAHASIPLRTQRRVQAIARAQGYRPDPMIAKLMSHLATSHSSRLKANLCAFTPALSPTRPDSYINRLLRSLRAGSESLGYSFSIINIDEYPDSPSRLRRVLRNRNIEGIILTPMGESRDLRRLLDWKYYSVVSTTPSVARPQFHSVSPNHYDNARLVFNELATLGYRRIGLAIPADRDIRVRHRWSGAMAWYNLQVPDSCVQPLLDPGSPVNMDPEKLVAWARDQRPDVVVTDLAVHTVAKTLERAFPPRARPAVVAMHWPMPEAAAGVDQNVEEIGTTALSVLSTLIQHNQKGIPDVPHTTMIDGKWARGSLRRKPRELAV